MRLFQIIFSGLCPLNFIETRKAYDVDVVTHICAGEYMYSLQSAYIGGKYVFFLCRHHVDGDKTDPHNSPVVASTQVREFFFRHTVYAALRYSCGCLMHGGLVKSMFNHDLAFVSRFIDMQFLKWKSLSSYLAGE